MKPYDPSKPITAANWPPSLKMPPLRKIEKPKPAADEKSCFSFFA